MAEDYEDESEIDRKESQGNICVKSIVLLFFAIAFTVIITIVYGYFFGVLRSISPTILIIETDHFSSIVFAFAIGVVLGYIVREETIRRSGD